MILADCHTHSLCSPDSEAPMPAMAQRATELGLTTLCLTDHCDLLSLEGERTLTYDWAAWAGTEGRKCWTLWRHSDHDWSSAWPTWSRSGGDHPQPAGP